MAKLKPRLVNRLFVDECGVNQLQMMVWPAATEGAGRKRESADALQALHAFIEVIRADQGVLLVQLHIEARTHIFRVLRRQEGLIEDKRPQRRQIKGGRIDYRIRLAGVATRVEIEGGALLNDGSAQSAIQDPLLNRRAPESGRVPG